MRLRRSTFYHMLRGHIVKGDEPFISRLRSDDLQLINTAVLGNNHSDRLFTIGRNLMNHLQLL
jgi:hypothetical protein